MALTSHLELKLDSASSEGFISYFNKLPEKPSTTFRFFDRTDYYTVHGVDALYIAKEVYRTNSVVKQNTSGSKQLDYVVLSRINFETTVREMLLVKHYRVEVYKLKEGRKNDWELRYKASPGNIAQFEDLLFSKTDLSTSVGMIGIKTDANKKVGVAYIDATQRIFELIQFDDSDELSTLEAILVQKSPRECVIPSGETAGFEKGVLQKIVGRSGVLVTERKRSEFDTKDLIQDLNRLLKFKKGEKHDAGVRPELEKTVAIAALAAVIKYMELGAESTNHNQFLLGIFDARQYMRLDPAAVRALNLVPTPIEGPRSNKNITGLLNKCRTPQGQRLLSQWIKQPLVDLNQINERHDVVEAFVGDTQLRQLLYDEHLRRIPDFQKMSKKFQRKRATLQDCYRVYQTVQRLPHLIQVLRDYDGKHRDLVSQLFANPLEEYVGNFSKFVAMVETTLDMEQVKNGEFMVKAEFDENLQELRDQMEQLEADMKALVKKAALELGMEPFRQFKFEHNQQLGFFFRITRKDERSLRGHPSFSIIDTKKDGVRFRNSKLREHNDDYLEAKSKYEEVQRAVVVEVVAIAAGYSEPMLMLSDVTARLDALISFAQSSAMAPIPYVRPQMKELGSGFLKLEAARHPCLEVQDKVNYIANDAYFEREKEMFHIITGPNMGGKSTYIRSVGCVVLMAQIGCFVPCDSATISIVDSIMARVGAGDSQVKGVSTFMAEMLETAAILRTANENSLIIIDELGRGTSTYDGFGLAWAISEHIANDIKGMCMFATHFHELTDLADVVPEVSNLHVTALAKEDSLTLLYKVMPGVCDQSFGIHVARMVSFPRDVIEFAEKRSKQLEDYQSVGVQGTDLEGNDVPAQKRRRTEKKEGLRIIQNFLDQARALPVDELSDAQLQEKLDAMRKEATANNNLFVADVIARGGDM